MSEFQFTYEQGAEYMKELGKTHGSGCFSVYQNIVIHYPGYKKTGDYRLEIRGERVPSHTDICQLLYTGITENGYSFPDMKNLLECIYFNGTLDNFDDEHLEYLKYLIFWVTLQEEINYPRSQHYAGINLAFCRYYEAICCTQTAAFCIDDVYARCNNYGNIKPPLYEIKNASKIYHY